MIGKVISHYKIIDKLGEGGMGIVYKAEDTKLNRFVALKFLHQEFTRDAEGKERFVREARAASALDDPNICTIYEINETEDGRMYICMAYYDAETLKQKIENGPLLLEEAIRITEQICRGLSKAHKKGLIHRDIKPANILITKDGVVKIVDFGLVKSIGQTRLTKDNTSMGTVAYLSPEQASGDEVDAKADIWAVGVMLYEMLSGQLPFKGDIDQVMIYSILHEDPIPLASNCPNTSKEIELVIKKALYKEVDQRYQRIEEMGNDLNSILDANIQMKSLNHMEKETRGVSIKKKLWIPALAFLGLILAFLVSKQYIFEKSSVRDPIPIAVISFQNQTGNEAYDYLQEAIPNLLISSLEQSPDLHVMTWERMHDLLKQMNKPNIQVIDKNIGFELCHMEGVNLIVIGSYMKADDEFMTDVKVLDVSSKDIINTASSQGEGLASILRNQIDDLSREISQGVGLSEQRFRKTHVELAQVTTSSMEAYRNFLQGRDLTEKSCWEDALPFLKQAVELDSTFSMAYLYLARAYWNLYQSTEGGHAFELAKKYSYKTTEKERLYIEEADSYYEHDKRYNILKEMARKYPKEKRVFYRSGEYNFSKRKLGEAIIALNKSLDLAPDYGPALNLLTHTYLASENFDEALEIQKRYVKKYSNEAEPLVTLGDLYFRTVKLKNAINEYENAVRINPKYHHAYLKLSYCCALMEEYDAALKWIDNYTKIAKLYGSEGEIIWWTAFYQIWLGQFDSSKNILENMIHLAREYNASHGVAMAEFLMGRVYYEHKDFETSRSYFKNAFEEFSKNDPLYYIQFYKFYIGIADLKKGEIDSAESILSEIKELMPTVNNRHPWWQEPVNYLYYMLQAEVLLEKDKAQEAITIAAKTNPEHVPPIPSMLFVFYNVPPHHDVLARAYQQAGLLDKAIAEYERLTQFRPESKDRRLIYPVYYYYLAKLYQETNQIEEAVVHYQKFLDIWKDADPDLPEMIDANNRLKQLSENRML